jgi:hypothetical protein
LFLMTSLNLSSRSKKEIWTYCPEIEISATVSVSGVVGRIVVCGTV